MRYAVGIAAVTTVMSASAARADVTVTFVAPAGAHVVSADGTFRTTDRQPVIGIEVNGATQSGQLGCELDFDPIVPCGPALPGCQAQSCASFQPPAPVDKGIHNLLVQVPDDSDPHGVTFEVDTTPPVVGITNAAHGLLFADQAGGSPFRPPIQWSFSEDGHAYTPPPPDCSAVPARTAPNWHRCARAERFGPLPHRHREYVVGVRATDDFGRTDAVSALYDPVPCTLSARRPRNLAALSASGIRVRGSCDATRAAWVEAFLFAIDGHRTYTPRGAVSEAPPIGRLKLKAAKGTTTFDFDRMLRVARIPRGRLAALHSLGIVLAAGDPDTVSAQIADDTLAYATMTVRR
jgi:hypothetical protein